MAMVLWRGQELRWRGNGQPRQSRSARPRPRSGRGKLQRGASALIASSKAVTRWAIRVHKRAPSIRSQSATRIASPFQWNGRTCHPNKNNRRPPKRSTLSPLRGTWTQCGRRRFEICHLEPDEINKGRAKIAAKWSLRHDANPHVIPGRRAASSPESISPDGEGRSLTTNRGTCGYGFRVRTFGAPRNDVAAAVTAS